jgi:hypothetical protein
MLRTIDGGKTIARIRGAHHGDHHDLWIDPKNPKRMIDGNDGGVDLSWNGGETWYCAALPLGQFYHVAVGQRSSRTASPAPCRTWARPPAPSNSLSLRGIRNGDWHDVGGGEAGTRRSTLRPEHRLRRRVPRLSSRYDHRTGMTRNVEHLPGGRSGHGAEDRRYRFQWTAPIHISPHDRKVVYHGANVLFRTTDGGQTWTAISPDLTPQRQEQAEMVGRPITGDNTGRRELRTIFAIAESPKEKGLIWVGTTTASCRSRATAAHWTTSRAARLPEWARSARSSRRPRCRARPTSSSTRTGSTTRAVPLQDRRLRQDLAQPERGLAQDAYLHAVREDPQAPRPALRGTERGIVFSRDDGATWEVLGLNLPTVARARPRRQGGRPRRRHPRRSIWVLDDLTPLREMSREIADENAHLFTPPPAVRWQYRSSFPRGGLGQEPAPGSDDQLLPQGEADRRDQPRHRRRQREAGEGAEQQGRARRAGSRRSRRALRAREERPTLSKDPASSASAGTSHTGGALKIKGAKFEGDDLERGPTAPPGAYTLKAHGRRPDDRSPPRGAC